MATRRNCHARRFELPGIHELTKEQELIRGLPKKGCHLIIGGPGTGKTVMTLLRARRHCRSREDHQFLVFNHLLNKASRVLAGEDISTATWMRWFGELYGKCVGGRVPKREPEPGKTWRPYDWDATIRAVESLDNGALAGPHPFLVIDEGQDMPPAFYDCLLNLGFGDIFVAADQNQQIGDQNSSREELRQGLDIGSGDVIELKKNHRNSLPIARLARAFFTGDAASPAPELPARGGSRRSTHVPRLNYYEAAALPRIAKRIWIHWDHDPRRLIGVVTPNNNIRRRWFDALRDAPVMLDNEKPLPLTHYGDYCPEIPWDCGGVLVINAQACKGLEFDTVVLADIDEHIQDDRDTDRTKKLFYVMVSRARERVVLFMKRGTESRIEEILPRADTILRRSEIRGG